MTVAQARAVLDAIETEHDPYTKVVAPGYWGYVLRYANRRYGSRARYRVIHFVDFNMGELLAKHEGPYVVVLPPAGSYPDDAHFNYHCPLGARGDVSFTVEPNVAGCRVLWMTQKSTPRFTDRLAAR
jgi:hypothetical protein